MIGSVKYKKVFYWSIINLKIVEMSSLDLSTLLMIEEIDGTRTRPTIKTRGSPPKQFSLLPSPRSFSPVQSYLSVCASVRSVGVVCPRKLFLKERAVRTRGYLIYIEQTHLYCALSFLIFHKREIEYDEINICEYII